MKKLNTIQSLVDGTKKVLPSSFESAKYVPIKSTKVNYMPGVKTKMFSAKAGGREDYNVTIHFYGLEEDSPILVGKTKVRVRCSCDAFFYYFMEANKLNDALALGRAKSYKPKGGANKKKRKPNNPKKIPGICKHLGAFIKALDANDIIN